MTRFHWRAALVAGALAVALLASPAAASEAAEAGIGAGAAFSTLLYSPIKVVYSVLGTVFGGIAWGLSGGDRDVMDAVITPAVLGDYVVTPSHLRGERPLEFFGRRAEYREPPSAVVEEPYASY